MKKKHLQIIKEIQSRVPKEYLDGLTEMQPLTPTVKEVVERAIADDTGRFDEPTKERLRNLLAAGMFSKEHEVINEEKEKLLDAWYGAEIQKAIKEGRLPPPGQDAFLKKLRRKHHVEPRRESEPAEARSEG